SCSLSSFLHAEAIDASVVRPDHNFAVHHRRRTADRLADFVRPKLVAVLERHDVKPAIVRADDDSIADHDRRTVHLALRGEGPETFAGVTFHAVQELVAAPEHDAVFGDCGRREVRKVAVLKSPQPFLLDDVDTEKLILVMA